MENEIVVADLSSFASLDEITFKFTSTAELLPYQGDRDSEKREKSSNRERERTQKMKINMAEKIIELYGEPKEAYIRRCSSDRAAQSPDIPPARSFVTR